MTSLRALLARRLAFGLALLFTAIASALFFVSRHVVVLQFDEALVAKARVLAMLVTVEPDGRLELEFDEAPLPELAPGPAAEYLALRDAGGRLLHRSASYGAGAPLARVAGAATEIRDVTLPDGRAGRAVTIRHTPKLEGAPATTPFPLELTYARERASLDRALRRLSLALVAATLLLALGAAAIVGPTLRRSLAPLSELASFADSVDASSLDARFPNAGLPSELRAIGDRLNDLLERVSAAFERERRFSADVAHELRTPLAELRACAEVALRWPDGDATKGALEDVLASTGRLEALVTTLLALARCEAGQQRVALERVDLVAAIEHAWTPMARGAAERGVTFALSGPRAVEVSADRALLGSMLRNVLGNAAAYATPSSEIACAVEASGRSPVLRVSNQQSTLSAADLPRLFAPFWRVDDSRTDDGHLGLGLPLVEAYARLCGVDVHAELPQPDRFSIALSFRAVGSP